MHRWGDEWFQKYGNDLRDAERWIVGEVFFRTGFILVSKEKYGTIRFEALLDEAYLEVDEAAWHTLWIVIQEAAIKWPHLKDELFEDVASYEEIVGSEIHDKYWTSFTEE